MEEVLEQEHLRDRLYAVSYFSRSDPILRSEAHRPALSPTGVHQSYMQNQYGRPQHLSHGNHIREIIKTGFVHDIRTKSHWSA